MRSPQTEATPANRQPPIKVTFDTNTLSDVVDPDQGRRGRLTELMRLTRTELCGLYSQITNQLTKFPEGSPDRTTAHQSCEHPRRSGAARLLSLVAQ
jgi:hypothetical protein